MRVAVVGWSMGHNAMSRGWYLADLLRRRHEVELVGPLVPWWPDDVWAPMRAAPEVPMRAFAAHDIACYLGEAERFAATVSTDIVYVSKPRVPGAALGDMIASRCGVPLVLDIDDLEASIADESDWMRRSASELIDEAAAITVSSHLLERRFGGTRIGQARDERVFDPSLYDRDAARVQLGYEPEDVVIMFLGTARRHKGVGEAAQALAELDDPRLRLCVIGPATDRQLLEELAAFGSHAVQLVGPRPVAETARLTCAGDVVCLYQDATSELALYQIPMKLTEALAMEVPVIATPTPSLEPFVQGGVVGAVDGTLAAAIDQVLADPHAARERARQGRDYFLKHLSYAALGPVLEDVLAGATAKPRPQLGALLASARDSNRCPTGGPAGHAADDREATVRLVRKLGREVRAKLRDALHGVGSCVLLGYPNHRNPGDHAVWLSAKRLLRDLGAHVDYEADWTTYSRDRLATAVDNGATILLTGGGNFGDLWPNTQSLRERVLADFPGVRTLQLPQSIQFDSPANRERTRHLLESHGNVTLLVREPESLARAREWFEVPSQLVPDLALVAPMPLVEAEPVVEIVWIARTDKESRGFQPPTDAADVELCDWMPVPDSELASRPDLPPGMRERLERNTLIMRAAKRGEELKQWELARLWEQLSRDRLALACAVVRRGRVVVTDRLHVHLMALHMGIPTVLADNSYGKVRAVYDSYTVSAPTARWARSPAEALAMARNWLGELDSAG